MCWAFKETPNLQSKLQAVNSSATMRSPPPPTCAICGADIPPHAFACPECGADERTGWREQDPTDGLDLPDQESTAEAYARFLRAQDGYHARRGAKRLFWWAIALAVAIIFIASMFFWRR